MKDKLTNVFIFYCRSHQKFIDDVLDAYIIAASLEHFNLESVDDDIKYPDDFDTFSRERQFEWISQQAHEIRKTLTTNSPAFEDVKLDVERQISEESDVSNHKKDGMYCCTKCRSKFKTDWGLVRHMKNKHGILLKAKTNKTPALQHPPDGMVPILVAMSFLARHTWDAYTMNDGDRVFRNLKFEFLYLYGKGHNKYRLWLWRMLAYEMALLTPCQALEYKWNVSVNTHGGLGNNISNDNFVETQVKAIKQQVASQGPNKCFASAQVVCKTTQIVSRIKETLMRAAHCHKGSISKPEVDTSTDIQIQAIPC